MMSIIKFPVAEQSNSCEDKNQSNNRRTVYAGYSVDTCVCCGAVVPEGMQVCYSCSRD